MSARWEKAKTDSFQDHIWSWKSVSISFLKARIERLTFVVPSDVLKAHLKVCWRHLFECFSCCCATLISVSRPFVSTHFESEKMSEGVCWMLKIEGTDWGILAAHFDAEGWSDWRFCKTVATPRKRQKTRKTKSAWLSVAPWWVWLIVSGKAHNTGFVRPSVPPFPQPA